MGTHRTECPRWTGQFKSSHIHRTSHPYDENTKDDGYQKEQKRLRIVTNGNTITYDDVAKNLQCTMADGIMSAEGLLDNPALYLPRLYSATHSNNNSSDSITVVANMTWTQRMLPYGHLKKIFDINIRIISLLKKLL